MLNEDESKNNWRDRGPCCVNCAYVWKKSTQSGYSADISFFLMVHGSEIFMHKQALYNFGHHKVFEG